MNRSDSNPLADEPIDPNGILDEFDAAWAAGYVPVIEEYRLKVPKSLQAKLLEDMLAIEWEYRARLGHRFDFHEYFDRFPEAAAGIEKLWNELRGQIETCSNTRSVRYEIRGFLDRGGIGEIFVAWDRSLKREVAFKILQAQFVDDPGQRRRFRREAEIIAKLENPNIIPIFDYGNFRNGEPFYSMHLVKDGKTLEDLIPANRKRSPQNVEPTVAVDTTVLMPDAGVMAGPDPGPTEIVEAKVTAPEFSTATETPNAGEIAGETIPELSPIEIRSLLHHFLKLSDAVKFAHSNGVLHRDIKPANVLLGPHGETFLIDWGLALDYKAKAEPGEELSEYERSFTASVFEGKVITPKPFKGTPVYCSPEQAKGLPSNESWDIYSLGATLYHLMTGQPPRSGPLEKVLEDARENRFVPPCEANPALALEMGVIIEKAMATRPQDRYRSAMELGNAVRAWMSDEPVSWERCRTESRTRRIGRFLRRHRIAAMTAAAILVASEIAVATRHQWNQTPNSTEPATPQNHSTVPTVDEASATQASQRLFAEIAGKAAELVDARAPGWSKKVDAHVENLDEIRKQRPAGIFPQIHRTRIARKSFSDLIESPGPAIPKLDVPAPVIAFRPGTRQAVIVEYDRKVERLTALVQLIDTDSGTVLWKGSAELAWIAAKPDSIDSLTFSPDGEYLVAASLHGQGAIWKLNLPANQEAAAKAEPKVARNFPWKIHEKASVDRMRWANSTARGLLLVTLCDDETVSVWEWQRLKAAAGGEKGPDGFVASRKFDAEVSDMLTPAIDAIDETIYAAIGGRLRKLRVDERNKSLKETDVLADSPNLGEPFVMAWHPSGSIVTAGRNAISIIDPRTSEIYREIRDPLIGRAHHGSIDSLEITSDGQYALTMSDEEHGNRMKIWNMDDPKDLLKIDLPGDTACPCGFFVQERAENPQRKRIWVWGTREPMLFDLVMPSIYQRFPTDVEKILAMNVSEEKTPHGETRESLALLTPGKENDKLQLLRIASDDRLDRQSSGITVKHGSKTPEVAISPDGDKVAIAIGENYVRVIRHLRARPTNTEFEEFPGSASNLIAWDSENRLFGMIRSRSDIRLIKAAQNPNDPIFSHHPAILAAPGKSDALTIFGATLYSGGSDGFIRAWNMKTPPKKGEISRIWSAESKPIYSLAVSEDSQWLVCGDRSGVIHLIDASASSDKPIKSISEAHRDLISSIAIANDDGKDEVGRIVASGGRDGSLKLWRLRNAIDGAHFDLILELPSMAGPIRKLRFIGPRKADLAVHADGLSALRIWSVPEILALAGVEIPAKQAP